MGQNNGSAAGVGTRKCDEQGGTGRSRRCAGGESRRNEAIFDCTGGQNNGSAAGVGTRKCDEQGGTGRSRRCAGGESRRNEAIFDCTGGQNNGSAAGIDTRKCAEQGGTPLKASRKRAAVALSGGVDSSVCAFLLKEQGYEVIGVTGKMVNSPNADIVVENARQVAEKLKIKHYVVDVCDDFQKNVVDYFEKAYKNGETPNPCIVCNKYIKWGTLFDYALNDLGADVFATGHYANIKKTGDFYSLYPAKDLHKDQLYFLYDLNQEQLSKTVFPLYEYEKSQIRKIATDNDLPSKSSKESQDICFIQKPMTTKKYLLEKIGSTKGDLVELKTGKKLGEHDGCFQFTVGQRKGIGVSSERPLYVIKTDAVNNIVYLGHEEENFGSIVNLTDTNIVEPITDSEFDAMVKIRYNMQAKKALVKLSQNEAKIEFYEPISSITSGQAGVIYDLEDGHLIGGGRVK